MTLQTPTGGHTVELAIGGMTCSSCSARIEKKLNRMPGVEATVNFATEKAKVTFADDVTVDDLVATVEATGYTAAPPAPPRAPGAAAAGVRGRCRGRDAEAQAAGDPRAVDALRQRVVGTAALTVPVILLAMVPALQFDYWQWLSLTLAAPVVTWGAWPFHRATWVNLRHGAATMDTLVSLGVLAAFGWSLYALFLGGAGEPGMTMPFTLVPERGSGADEVYLEVASGLTLFLLTGKWLEARAKRSSGAALRALLEMGAKDVAVVRDGVERRVPVDGARGRRRVRRPAGGEGRDRRRGRRGDLRGRRLDADRRAGAGRGRPRRRASSAPRSTPAAGWWSAPPGSVATPSWPRWPGWSRTRRTARRRCSGWPTGSPPSSCRRCSCSRWRRSASGSVAVTARSWPSPPPSPSWSSPARAPSAWRRRPPCSSAPVAARSSAS